MASNPLFYQCLSPRPLLPTGRPEARAPGNPCVLSLTHPERPVQAALGRTTPCCALLRRAGGTASAARDQLRDENAVWTSYPPAPEVEQTYTRARELCQQA